ncbi:flavodoxin [Enterococcus sp.]|uniref:flavodoxin n=1 Tax=Enterococcus sp. TaxID=35783 RepID=UPI002908518D|nr:flavodoxin [Enterococcus sp.]MDU5336722.1 flavodoxin [Enterococcus sp.]
MKKVFGILCGILFAVSLGACGSDNEEGASSSSNASSAQNVKIEGKTLVVYFSEPEKSGTDAVAGASRVVENGEVVGNTQFLAETVSEETEAELFRIETVKAYPSDHDELVDYGEQEQNEEARPELKAKVDDLDDYDTIFIGYPIWFSDLPMPLYTFLDEHDFSGKTIIPFSTNGGSSMSGTITTITDMEPGAEVSDNGISISRDNISGSKQEVIDWVNEFK